MRDEERRILEWLIARIAAATDMEAEDIDPDALFAETGLASREALLLAADLEDFVGRTISPTLVWEQPSIRAVASYLAAGEGAS
jgi:phthiocerol/phenolphthiocerol synthesis type-I polyketide synthase D